MSPKSVIKKKVVVKPQKIPDKDHLYKRVHKIHVINGKLNLGMVFINIDGGMSTDWSKFSTPNKTRDRVIENNKNPHDFGVIIMKVKLVREIKDQLVIHTPDNIKNNPAHTDVTGEKDAEAQVLFNRISTWAIKI